MRVLSATTLQILEYHLYPAVSTATYQREPNHRAPVHDALLHARPHVLPRTYARARTFPRCKFRMQDHCHIYTSRIEALAYPKAYAAH